MPPCFEVSPYYITRNQALIRYKETKKRGEAPEGGGMGGDGGLWENVEVTEL